MKLDFGVEGEEKRFRDGRDMGGIRQIEKYITRALAVSVSEINGLRLQIRQDGLNRRAELPGLRSRVAELDWDCDYHQKTHGSSPIGLPTGFTQLASIVLL